MLYGREATVRLRAVQAVYRDYDYLLDARAARDAPLRPTTPNRSPMPLPRACGVITIHIRQNMTSFRLRRPPWTNSAPSSIDVRTPSGRIVGMLPPIRDRVLSTATRRPAAL